MLPASLHNPAFEGNGGKLRHNSNLLDGVLDFYE